MCEKNQEDIKGTYTKKHYKSIKQKIKPESKLSKNEDQNKGHKQNS